jgi:formimidoylglutamate deiminase
VKKYFAHDALLPGGWARDVLLGVDGGALTGVEVNGAPEGAERLHGPLLPGMANLHSHAFQRGMAGLTEVRASAHDDFWSWRELMYQFMARLTPEQAHAIAVQLYIEMLMHGYTAVAEFHYVHHPAEMLARHLDASRETGIAITLLPALYRWSGFGSQPLKEEQRRFASDSKTILDLVAGMRKHVSADVRTGVAPHSLRAVDPQSLKELVAAADERSPVHIHAAEQTREVEECTLAFGKRPVEWLLDNCPVDGRWCVVHATHLVASEVTGLAASGAVAGLCPSTEANLGDGIFPLLNYRGASGRYGIGGDSHVSRDPAEELRLLEYVQRLVGRRRNLTISSTSPAVGTTLWLEAAAGGAQALGREMGALAEGRRADFVVLDGEHPDVANRRGDAIANAFIFSGSSGLVRDVMVAGRWVVQERHHALEERAAARYARAVQQLLA